MARTLGFKVISPKLQQNFSEQKVISIYNILI